MKVLFITNVPYPYTVNYLSELGKRCELTALFERTTSSERDKSWGDFNFTNCKAIIMKGIKVGVESSLCLEVIKRIKEERADLVLISNPCTPTGIIEQEYMRVKKIKYCIQSEGAFVGNGWGFKERLKKHIMESAELYFSTGKLQDEYFVKYGAKEEQIRRFPFTSLWENEIVTYQLSKEEKEKKRLNYNIEESIVIICVGRFIPGKGIDILLKALIGIEESVRTLIIGGEPTEEYLNICEQGKLKGITFIPHISKNELKEYYSFSDMFVLPTYSDTWGLVIVEAMSNGLPVISTSKCVAACTLIEDDVNGYVLEAGDVDSFREHIIKMIHSREMMRTMGENALVKMNHYSIESMAEVIQNGLNEIVTTKKK